MSNPAGQAQAAKQRGGNARGGAWRRWVSRGLPAVGALALLSGCVAYVPRAPVDVAALTAEEHTEYNLRVYDAAWELVRRGYYDRDHQGTDWSALRERHRAAAAAARDEQELYNAVNTLLRELDDDHTRALPPGDVAAERQTQRVLLGLIMGNEDPGAPEGSPLLVLQVMPGGSAAEAGVLPGWVLVTCDGRPPRDVLGPGRLTDGQVVQCAFRDHEGEIHTVALTARTISVRPVQEFRALEGGLVYLRFDKFETASARWLREQLKLHAAAPGIVLDLRYNPGGDAAALGRMLGEFFPRAVDIGTFITRRGFNFRLNAWRWFGSACYTGPLAVLVSENSASSSEIFAAVVHYHERAAIIGATTAGAVLASRRFALPGGGRLQMSIDDYVTPDGRRLEGTGVKPDIAIETTAADLRAGHDPVLEAAIAHLHGAGARAGLSITAP